MIYPCVSQTLRKGSGNGLKSSGYLRKAFVASLPVMAGYVFLGIAYGIAMQARGFRTGWSVLISIVVYGGSLQFAMIDPMATLMPFLTFALLCLLIQARHLFYGLTMLEPYNRAGIYKPYLIFALSDETYSLVCNGAPQGVSAEKWFAAVSGFDQLWWVTGTVLGAVLGSVIPMQWLTGIDFSMTALFIVIMTEQTMDAVKMWKVGNCTLTDVLFAPLIGFLGTLGSLLLAGKESFLLFAMAIILVGFFVRYRTEERGKAA
ncbi:MAG: AzlC family ABC transporter permease [Clostridia bacterium]|nr:AzlC family ABC transporter permease [Clostridia bacterium]MBR1685112.1 AzlC family ABC transporter permease [Clostridia bacterium]MBR2287564.1 AzlC family ABC transporter permease [Clostridia bacterium]